MRTDTQNFMAAGLNLIGQGLSIFDSDLRLVLGNARLQAMFGFPDALMAPGASFEAIIRHVAESGDYGDIGDVEAFVQQRVEMARAFEAHYIERTRANGQIISVEGAPLPQGGWVTVYTDITQTKRQEALLRGRASELSEQVVDHAETLAQTNRELEAANKALAEAKRQLIESEARIRLTTEMMPAHIAHIAADGRYTFSNRRLNAILPGSPADVLGHDFESAVGPSAYHQIRPHLEEALKGRASVFEFTHTETGRRIRVAFNPDGDGGVYIMSMNITAETQARVALQQTRRRELAAQVTSGLAHNFSNLLTIILGMQSKLQDRDDLPVDAAAFVEATLAAARRGGALLDRISDITATRHLRPSAVQIQDLLRELQVLAAPTLPASIDLQITSEVSSQPVMLDGGQLLDSLLNLILNARDACGTTGKILVTAREVGAEWLEIRVEDNGTGFTEETRGHALEPFFTTKGSEGSGLGLSMVFDMVKLAGGDLRLGNGPDGGAAIRLRLPLRYAPENTGGLAMLVEDDDQLRAQYRDMLMSEGFLVIEATSVDEALALLADLPDICLILSDLRLQGALTGVDLARRSAGIVPTILMTSLPSTDPLHRAALAEAPVLSKPFEAAHLSALLQTKAAE